MNTPSVLIPWKPLYPSQRSGAVMHERAFWRGEERQFIIQWHEDRAYFGLCDGRPTMWATLEECAEGDAVACFEDALHTRRYGVCFKNNGSVRTFRMGLHFIYAPDGTGLVREWSSRDWIAFAPQETRAWALFPDVLLPAEGEHPSAPEFSGCCRAAIDCVENELLMRRVSEEECERLSLHSTLSREEFERVVLLLWQAEMISTETTGFFMPKARLCSSAEDSVATFSLELDGFSEARSSSPLLQEWLNLYSQSEGFEWRDTGWGTKRFHKLRSQEPRLRAFWAPFPVSWEVNFVRHHEPTFHEQLEARLELRDWLQNKVPQEQVESWLSP